MATLLALKSLQSGSNGGAKASAPARGLGANARMAEIVLDLVDHLDAMVSYWDTGQTCVFANNAFHDWFGKSKEEVVGMTLAQLLGPHYERCRPYFVAALDGRTSVFERELSSPSGQFRSSLVTYTPHIVDGHVVGVFSHVADVTPFKLLEQELRVAKAKAEEMATHDFLTGLPNRVLLMDRFCQAIAVAKRQDGKIAVLSFDLDGFKQVNDTYGHGTGDWLLVEVGRRLTSTLRDCDTVGRMGGDEFMMIAGEIESKGQAEALTRRILKNMRRPFELGTQVIAASFSVGIALYPRDGTTPGVLMAKSDQALYAAKNLGKNGYAFSGPELV